MTETRTHASYFQAALLFLWKRILEWLNNFASDARPEPAVVNGLNGHIQPRSQVDNAGVVCKQRLSSASLITAEYVYEKYRRRIPKVQRDYYAYVYDSSEKVYKNLYYYPEGLQIAGCHPSAHNIVIIRKKGKHGPPERTLPARGNEELGLLTPSSGRDLITPKTVIKPLAVSVAPALERADVPSIVEDVAIGQTVIDDHTRALVTLPESPGTESEKNEDGLRGGGAIVNRSRRMSGRKGKKSHGGRRGASAGGNMVADCASSQEDMVWDDYWGSMDDPESPAGKLYWWIVTYVYPLTFVVSFQICRTMMENYIVDPWEEARRQDWTLRCNRTDAANHIYPFLIK